MKLSFLETHVHRSEDFEEASFGIGDVRVIFEILRSKLYPSPIKSFTQEIMSNARDAHREVGKNDIPIEVKLPSNLDRTFSVRDYGPGISPDRMLNVFILYGCSSKRDSDEYTGGFGIGAKSPWAYSDTFGIVSITPDENGNLIKREYVAYIDESRIGKLALISTEPTTEAQGTTIIVACKSGDEYKFADYVKKTTRYWTVKPKVSGVWNWEYPNHKVLFSGKNWFIADSGATTNYYGNHQAIALVDEIPYILSWDHLNLQQWDDETRNIASSLFRLPVFLKFNISEITLAANREEIDYQDKTITKIQSALKFLIDELKLEVDTKIKDAKNLWEANLLWMKIKRDFHEIFAIAHWTDDNGNIHELRGHKVSINNCGCKVWRYHSTNNNSQGCRKARWSDTEVQIDDDAILLIHDDDTEQPARRKLATIFADGKVKNATVLIPNIANTTKDAVIQELKDKFYIDLYNPTYLSTVPKAPVVRKTSGRSGNVSTGPYKTPKAYKFISDYYNKSDMWQRASVDVKNGTGVYVLIKSRTASCADTNTPLGSHTLKDMEKLLGQDIYAFPERLKDKIGSGWVSVCMALETKMNTILADKYITEYEYEMDNTGDTAQNRLSLDFRKMSKVKDKNGLMYEYIEYSEKVQNAISKLKEMDRIRRTLYFYLKNNTTQSKITKKSKLEDYYVRVSKKYPMLFVLANYNVYRYEEQVIDYINLVDRDAKSI